MVDIQLQKSYSVSAAKVWDLIQNFGDMAWAGMDKVEVEGEGVGMVRIVDIGMPEPICEQLTAFDPQAMSFSYTISAGNPLPVKDFLAGASVHAEGEQACRVEWFCRCAPEGMSDEDVAALLSPTYEGLLETIAKRVEA